MISQHKFLVEKEVILLDVNLMSFHRNFQPDGQRSDRDVPIGNFEWLHTKGDGSFFMVDVALTELSFGNGQYVQAIMRGYYGENRSRRNITSE